MRDRNRVMEKMYCEEVVICGGLRRNCLSTEKMFCLCLNDLRRTVVNDCCPIKFDCHFG